MRDFTLPSHRLEEAIVTPVVCYERSTVPHGGEKENALKRAMSGS